MRFALTLSLAAVAALAGCGTAPKKAATAPAPVAAPAPAPVAVAPAPVPATAHEVPKITEPFFGRTKLAVATLSPAAGGTAIGVVNFSVSGSNVDVHVQVAGLVPGSVHGFHVHETGNCASADFMSAGGHFNPTKQPHGPQGGPHHAGDMPSLLADPTGKIDTTFTVNNVVLGGPEGFVGHSVILHAGPDDYATQPTGNSGGRIACGVIAAQ